MINSEKKLTIKINVENYIISKQNHLNWISIHNFIDKYKSNPHTFKAIRPEIQQAHVKNATKLQKPRKLTFCVETQTTDNPEIGWFMSVHLAIGK